MQSNRDFYVIGKPNLVLTKSFKVINNLEIGQIGQLKISGTIKSEKLNEISDNGCEYISKIILVDRVESTDAKGLRNG